MANLALSAAFPSLTALCPSDHRWPATASRAGRQAGSWVLARPDGHIVMQWSEAEKATTADGEREGPSWRPCSKRERERERERSSFLRDDSGGGRLAAATPVHDRYVAKNVYIFRCSYNVYTRYSAVKSIKLLNFVSTIWRPTHRRRLSLRRPPLSQP